MIRDETTFRDIMLEEFKRQLDSLGIKAESTDPDIDLKYTNAGFVIEVYNKILTNEFCVFVYDNKIGIRSLPYNKDEVFYPDIANPTFDPSKLIEDIIRKYHKKRE